MSDIVERLRSPEFADVVEKYLMAEAANEIERLCLALEEIIQAADLDASKWVIDPDAPDWVAQRTWVVIPQHLIERARVALDEPHEFRQSVPPAIG